MQPTGVEGRYLVRGHVTFRGISRSYVRETIFTAVDDRTLRIEGESTFNVRDYGMEPPKILMLKVEPEVRVRVEIIAEKEV